MSSHDLDVQRAVDEAVLHPPAMHIGVDGVMQGGRRRERRRRLTTAGMSLAAVLLVVTGWLGLGNGADVLGDRIAPAGVPVWDVSAALDEPIRPYDGWIDEGVYGASIAREPGDAHFRVASEVDGNRIEYDPVDADLPGGAEMFRVAGERLVVIPTQDGVIPELVLRGEGDWAGSSWSKDTEGGPLAFIVMQEPVESVPQVEAADVEEVVWIVPGTWWGRDADIFTGTGAVVHRDVLKVQEERVEIFIVEGSDDLWGEVENGHTDGRITAGGGFITGTHESPIRERVITFVPRGSTDLRLMLEGEPDVQLPLQTASLGRWIATVGVVDYGEPGMRELRSQSAVALAWTSPDGVRHFGVQELPVQE